MGAYEHIRENVLGRDADGGFPLWKAVLAGGSAGAIGRHPVVTPEPASRLVPSLAGQFLADPTDLVKVQMQMEGRRRLMGLPPRVHGTVDAFRSIFREGGIRRLWKGWAPNIQRAAMVNMGDLTTYDTGRDTCSD